MNDAKAFPTEFHQPFSRFVGTFAAEVKLWFGPGNPQVMTGTMTNSLQLNNQFLHQEYEGDQVEGSFPRFRGRGYLGYNTGSAKYEGFWVDTASTIMMQETGEVDETGRVWTMRGQFNNPQNGELMQKKSIITIIDEDHHRAEQFMQTPTGLSSRAWKSTTCARYKASSPCFEWSNPTAADS